MIVNSCIAQTIVNLNAFNQGDNSGKYFKDIDNNFNPFLGIWEWQNGNQIFRVELWKVEMKENKNGNEPSFYLDKIQGHFEMVESGVQGQQLETNIYTSNKNVGDKDYYWPPVINLSSTNGTSCGGIIIDNIAVNNEYWYGLKGKLIIKLIDGTNPLKANWKVTLLEGIYGINQPTEFIIPTDIVLTKSD